MQNNREVVSSQLDEVIWYRNNIKQQLTLWNLICG